jgi:long-chain acyl-CoA synthetase
VTRETTAPIIEQDLLALLRDTVDRYGERTAIQFAGRDTSFAAFAEISDRVAAGLHAQDIRHGDRVALYCPNSDVFALAYFGILKAGASVVPINLLFKPAEIEYILRDAEAAGLIYHENFTGTVAAIRPALPALKTVVRIGEQECGPDELSWTRVAAGAQPAPRIALRPADDVASILYTSGTTGQPKGAMLTHRNLANNTRSVMEALQFSPDDTVILTVLPMFHAFAATACMLTPLLHGLTFVPVPKFDPATLGDTIARTGANVLMAVPSMFNALLRLPDEQVAKFRSLKFCVSGGAAMPVEMMRRFEERFGVLIYEGDGPTECSPVTCVNPLNGTRKPASVGLPLARVEMSIRDAGGNEVTDGTVGEICVRGPSIMKGYWKRPQETAESFFGDWFRTGDLGYRDGDGYFFIVDRIKDMVIVNGMNVYPRKVEEVLYQDPRILEAAVIGEPNEAHGEIPVAFVVLHAGQTATSADVRKFCAERLGGFEVPRKFFFVDALPKNAAGKILKRELRKHGEYERGVDPRA